MMTSDVRMRLDPSASLRDRIRYFRRPTRRTPMRLRFTVPAAVLTVVIGCSIFAVAAEAVGGAGGPYRVLRSEKVGGEGPFDYVYADADGRKLYVPRGDRVSVFELETLKPLAEIPGAAGARGVAVDPASG